MVRRVHLLAGAVSALTLVCVCGCPKKKSFHPAPDLRGHGEFVPADIRNTSWDTRAVILGDVDGDGDLDAFVVNYGEQNRLLLNDGAGEFVDATDPLGILPAGLPLVQDTSRCAAFGDVDGDGDLDVVVGNHGQNRLLLNDGHGEFTDGTDPSNDLGSGFPPGLEDTWAVALLNVDGEGGFDADLDLILVNDGQNRLLLNDGFGEFLDGTDLAGTYTTGLPMDSDAGRGILVFNADADTGDTDLDLLILNEGAPSRLYLNTTGFGEYADASFDTLNHAASVPFLSEATRSAATADVNGDGLADLVLAVNGQNRIWINRGAGFFVEGSSPWERERVLVDGGLHAIHGTPPATISVTAVGFTYDGAPPQFYGALRASPGNGTWSVVGPNVTQYELFGVWAAPGTASAFAAGKDGTVVTNHNTVPAGSWVDMAQGVVSTDLLTATGTSVSDVYFAGAEGRVLRWNGTSFALEREFTDRDLAAIHGAGPGDVFLAGQLGTILKGGASGFTPLTSSTSVQINDLFAVGAADAFAVGTGGTILRYWDQGGSQPLDWYAESPGVFTSFSAVGAAGGVVWVTGGEDVTNDEFTVLRYAAGTWTSVLPGVGPGEDLNDLWVDPATGAVFFVGANEAILECDAAGATWVNHSTATPSLRIHAVDGTSASNVAAVGEDGSCFHFNGTAWSRHDAPSDAEDLTAIWLEDATHAWVCGTGGTLYRLDLGTWTWTAVSPAPTPRDLLAVWGSGAADVYVCGAGGILLHFDGTAWRVRESGKIQALFALDATHVYAAGPSGLVLMGDGAGAWTALPALPSAQDLHAVWAGAPNDVTVVGAGGTIARFDGVSWTLQGAPTTVDLYAVFGAAGAIWAGGDDGVLLENTGAGWDDSTVQAHLWMGTNDRITGVWATGPTDVYACTLEGCLFHYKGGVPAAGFNTPVLGDSHAVRILNLNADGSPDILVAGAGANEAWVNNGFGWFTDVSTTALPVQDEDSRALAHGGLYRSGTSWALKTTLDGDTDGDLVVANARGQNRLWLNSGTGTFTDGTDTAAAGPTGLPALTLSTAVALGDVDGDGLPDALVARWGTANRLFLNRGNGRFEPALFPPDTDPSTAAALADMDGDGDLDAIFASDGAAVRVYVNDGQGVFSAPATPIVPPDVFRASSVAVADFNDDGAPDLAFGVRLGANRLYLSGAGALALAAGALPADADDTRAVAAADVDGDGAPDLVFANDGTQNRLLVNRLASSSLFVDGTFALITHLPADADPTRAVAAGDVNGDGFLDLVLVNDGEQDRLLVNDGVGGFTDGTDLPLAQPTGLPVGRRTGRCATLVDVDHDGDLDLVVGNAREQNRLFLNDGAGEFTDGTDEVQGAPSGLPVAAMDTTAIAAADLDGDGDPDLFATFSGGEEILLNR